MQGTRGAIRSGGDGAAPLVGEKPTQEPLARFSGVVKVGRMAPRMSPSTSRLQRLGEGDGGGLVEDPHGRGLRRCHHPRSRGGAGDNPALPGAGDRSQLHIEINPVEAETGTYKLDVNLKGPVTAALDPTWQNLRIEKGKKTDLVLPLTGAGLGMAEIELTFNGGGHNLAQTLRLPVKSSAPSVVNRIARPIPNGQTLEISRDLLSEMVPGSGSVGVSASPYTALDAAACSRASIATPMAAPSRSPRARCRCSM